MALNGHHDADGEKKHAGHQWCYVCDDANAEDKHYECHDLSGEFNLTLFLEYYSFLSFFFLFGRHGD